ncbi:extracellular cell wall glucanase Crf1/allergen Asp F9 [Thelonectria olida]|uniref:Crh-like protein n=1 Tax=Thelonectria olida TaxID=1576542 RepID=A0A9P8VYN6_9HYPO|nr:extracellular cell wall glucanase Crf1/allergen Asp F9 [Thelonectria olida]
MLHNRVTFAVVATAAFVTGVVAQTSSSCNPLKKTTCSDNTALSKAYSVDFTNGADSDNWSSVGSGDPSYTDNGAEFVVKKKGNAPTIQSEWYIFFGRVEVHMKAASGTGIVSSAVLLSDDLDEVDWEWLGGDNTEVQTNYFSKGDTSTSDREVDATVSDAQGTSHNYTVDWTKESCTWYIDGTAVRTLAYSDTYPQTPMRVKLGIWAGGDSDNAEGTITWAGGETDYDDGPFTMTVESIKVTNYNPAGSYTYGDQTGDYDSIVINDADSDSSSTTTSSAKSTATSTLTTKTKTTSATKDAASSSTASASASGSASATPSSSVTLNDNTSAADSTGSSSDDDSSSTPASSSAAAATTSSSTNFGETVSPRIWIMLSAFAAVAMVGHF